MEKNLPRLAMALLFLAYVSESRSASTVGRGYYSSGLESSSSGSEELSGLRDEEDPASSSESGSDLLNMASLLARPTNLQNSEGRVAFLETKGGPLKGTADEKDYGQGSESQGPNEAFYEALDRKYEEARNNGDSKARAHRLLGPRRRFGKPSHSQTMEPELYRPVKRNLACMRQCMTQAKIHPVQCHSLC